MPFVMCGVPRSGSTLVWQILSAVFPEYEIPQNHPGCWEADGKTVSVVTIRDPRAVAASRYRVRLSRDPSTGDLPGLQAEIHYMKFTFSGIKKILAGGPSALLRYEDFFHDRSVIYDMIKHVLGREVSVEDQERINALTSMGENKKRAAKLSSFLEVGEMKVHGDHVGDHAAPGDWKKSLPPWGHSYVEVSCAELCREWGYL